MKYRLPQEIIYWYFQDNVNYERLIKDEIADVVVVGGGMAGLSAAQSFRSRGLSVVLVEKNFCGSGATGKSSGFITQNAEYSLSDFASKFNKDSARTLWEFVSTGVDLIENNIKNFSLNCDYGVQDTLMVANSESKFKSQLLEEYNIRKELGYITQVYDQNKLSNILGSDNYYGAISHGGTFGINGYKYCQNMKSILKSLGVKIFENTPVIKIDSSGVETPYGKIKAKYIIVCVDRFLPDLDKFAQDIYTVQTFLMISQVLSQNQVKEIFKENKYMVWDTDMVYQYWRLTGDNRLLLGGSSVFSTYVAHEKHDNRCMHKKLTKYFKNKFPKLDINFEYMWPGLIGVTKDVIPMAGSDKNHENIYYISGATGLPWAAALGQYSAERLIDNKRYFDNYFSPYRQFPVNHTIQKFIGKKLTFAISNFLSLKSI